MNREVRLKNGAAAEVRPLTAGDVASLWACENAITRAGEGVVRRPDQISPSPGSMVADLTGWIDGSKCGERGAFLVCVPAGGGAVMGSATVRRMFPSRIRHVAHLSVGVHPEFQGLGVGRALMEAIIAWAETGEGRGVTRLDLDVFAVNHRAVGLYRSLGFEIEGTRRDFVRFEDGTFSDDHVMALRVPRTKGG